MNTPVVSVAQKVWAILAKENIRAHLVGTAGMLLHGFDYDPPDVDFLCETMPLNAETAPPDPKYKDKDGSREMTVDGIGVNLILVNTSVAPFLAPEPVIIEGIPVAPLEFIINLKRRADRLKDRRFFRDHPEMDI